jgi:hypothetical protein
MRVLNSAFNLQLIVHLSARLSPQVRSRLTLRLNPLVTATLNPQSTARLNLFLSRDLDPDFNPTSCSCFISQVKGGVTPGVTRMVGTETEGRIQATIHTSSLGPPNDSLPCSLERPLPGSLPDRLPACGLDELWTFAASVTLSSQGWTAV